MYIQRWFSLQKTERMFLLLFEYHLKDKKGVFDFKDYYNPFINVSWSEDLEFQMWEAFELYRTSQPYINNRNRLVFIEPDIDLLEVNKELLFTFLELFKKHLEVSLYE